MKITTDIMRVVEPAADIRRDVGEFDYVDVLGFSAKPRIPPDARVLWCASRADTDTDQSWYGATFNRADKIDLVQRDHPNWVILTDDPTVELPRTIVVPNVQVFLEKLHRWVLETVAPVVVGVTGSVGKTTCVALLEDVLAGYGDTLRLYAKRIAPLNLFEMVINQLELRHRFIVTEYAMFYRWHVAALTRLLPPRVGVMLPLDAVHLGTDELGTVDDIFAAKAPLLTAASVAFVEESVAQRFDVPGAQVFSGKSARQPEIVPFIESHLQYIQIAAAFAVKEHLVGPVTAADIAVVNQFSPKENRLHRLRDNVFFDGDVSVSARLKALGDTDYSPRILVIQDYGAESDYDKYAADDTIARLRIALGQFDAVYVSDQVSGRFRDLLARCAPIADYGGAIPVIPGATMFVHWGSYWRTFADLDAALKLLPPELPTAAVQEKADTPYLGSAHYAP